LISIARVRWNGKPRCPYCRSRRHVLRAAEARYHCIDCNVPYSITTQTVFHRTRVDLQKWFALIPCSTASADLPTVRALGLLFAVDKNTAQLMLARVRKAWYQERRFMS